MNDAVLMHEWKIKLDHKCCARPFDEEWLVYHRGDGNTHLLSGLNGLVYELLRNSSEGLMFLQLLDAMNNLTDFILDEDTLKHSLGALKDNKIVKLES